MSALLFRLFCVVCACSLFACTKSHDVAATALSLQDGGVLPGDDGDDGNAGTKADKDKDAGQVGVGKPDTGVGSAGKGGSGGGGNSCVATACDAAPMLPIPGIMIGTCCTTDDKCGFDVSQLGMGEACLEQDAPGDLDPSCPPVSFMGIVDMAGCCRPDGTCGSQDTFLGLGCTLNADDQGIPCNPGPI